MNKLTAPLSLSALCALLVACGGESNVIYENPSVKPAETTATGCTASTNSNCMPFVLEYPVAGLQYMCSSDKLNLFRTQTSGNTVTGGCDKTDTATFFLNAGGNARIALGSVAMSNLGQVATDAQPVHLTLLQLAQGLTGKAANTLDSSDATVQVAMKLVQIFQAVSTQKLGNVIGDIQPLTLNSATLAGLNNITSSVGLNEYQNGQYVSLLQPWVDVSQVSDAQALATLKKAINITQGALYQADLPTFTSVNQGMIGTSSGIPQQTFIGTFFLMNDRQGYSHGYGIQWRGVPSQGSTTNTSAISLVSTTDPVMMRASTQNSLFSPLTQRISGFDFVTTLNETLRLTQGKLLNDYIAAGTEGMYQQVTGTTTTAPADQLAVWNMPVATASFSGSADIVKAYPISYLDNRVFKSSTTVKSGVYYFPLYATLNFKFNPTNGVAPPDVKLGIVIDEHGDIRTDMRAGSAATNDMSGQCGTVSDASAAQFVDNYGVTQYRIGTLSASNYQPTQQDLSVSPRIILSGRAFGDLDGTLLGLTGGLVGTSGTTANTAGVKINLYGLYNNANGNINMTDFSNGTAKWVNAYNNYKAIYAQTQASSANGATLTPAELNQVSRLGGTASITLASCYGGAKTR